MNLPFRCLDFIEHQYFIRNLTFYILKSNWTMSMISHYHQGRHCKFWCLVKILTFDIDILSKGEIALSNFINKYKLNILIWIGSHLRLVHQQIQSSLCASCCPQEKGVMKNTNTNTDTNTNTHRKSYINTEYKLRHGWTT